ncbi:MAG: thioesterase [Desulfobacula sp.]|nr:thioesterase [Desulfobacula sp.]
MKIKKLHTIGFFDVDCRFNMMIQTIGRLFQDMATTHSAKVGVGYHVLSRRGVVWFLHRLQIEVVSYPKLGDEILILTWSRGFKGFKGFREYVIQSPNGDVLVKGSSVWLFYNLNRKRISKVPREISDCYEFETQKQFNTEIDDWKSCGKIEPQQQIGISLRYSDFDINGHVNNTIYLGFLESLYHDILGRKANSIKTVKIKFCREIDYGKKQIDVGWQKSGDRFLCNIYDDSILFAEGEIILAD